MSLRVAVVGAGVAGLAAAECLLNSSAVAGKPEVTVFEARPACGGRFNSWHSSNFGHLLDNGQHVLTGGCPESLELFGRTPGDNLRKISGPVFLQSNSTTVQPGSLSLLPPPVKYFPYLDVFTDSIAATLKAGYELLNLNAPDRPAGRRLDRWLEQNQPPGLVEEFWEPFVRSVYNRDSSEVSLSCFSRWLGEAVFKRDDALQFYFFRRPLAEVARSLAKLIKSQGATVRNGCKVNEVWPDTGELKPAGEAPRSFDRIISCLPPDKLESVLAGNPELGISEELESYSASPIVAVNLLVSEVPDVFERSPMVLLGTGFFDWLIKPDYGARNFIQLLTSAAHDQVDLADEQIVRQARLELEQLATGDSSPVETARVFRNSRATYAADCGAEPGLSSFDPPSTRLTVAGDWTLSDWPSTLEAAVRSGRRAAKSI